jgi:hypothetical protein
MAGVLGGLLGSLGKGKPGIPTNVVATNVGIARAYNNGAASVAFTAGSGPAATSFTVTSSPGGFTASGASSPLTVTGLASSTQYTYTVTATNAAGTSYASAASAGVIATTVPQAPVIGTATRGSASATVAYTAGATGGSAVSTFTATSSPSSITGTGASPITVSGLSNGTAYTFTVTATNANGTSTASSASNSVTPAAPPAGYTYSASAAKWYKLYPSTHNWTTANTTVTNDGGWLAVPKSATQNTAVKSASGGISVWLGLGDTTSSYTYTIRASLHPNFGSTSPVYQNWGAAQPNTSPAYIAQLSSGSWASVSASVTFNYVGEWF